jgi:uncharacterized protein YqeY
MTDLKGTLRSDLTEAIRGRDEIMSATLRMALSAITTEEVSGKAARALSDDEVLGVLTREAKKRTEAAAAFAEAGRIELAEREQAELAVLRRYLPQELTEDEVAALVDDAVAQVAADGATGHAAMGPVMKLVSARTRGRFDGRRLSELVRQRLG